jgi:hypothetical protein
MPNSPYATLCTRLAREQADLIAAARKHRYQSLLTLVAMHPSNLTPGEVERVHRYASALGSRSISDAVEAAIGKLKTLQSVGFPFESTTLVQ